MKFDEMLSYPEILQQLDASGNLRHIPGNTPPQCVDFSSNDYMGLAADAAVRQAFLHRMADEPEALMGSSASRLLAGCQTHYSSLENLLTSLYGRQALLFNSGYHANTGLLQALASVSGTTVVADRLVHASIIDGIVLSRAPFTRFRHNDYRHLDSIVAKLAPATQRIIIVVESVYSMDGDRADLQHLVNLKHRYADRIMLYVDEAHAFGAIGPKGLGMSRDYGSDIDIIVGTFGKAAASMGAFAVLDPMVRQFVINRARSFIFSTALPPLTIAWSHMATERLVDMDDRRSHLAALGRRLHSSLRDLGAKVPDTPGHIIPLLVGNARAAVELSQHLLALGFKALPIRSPTVPAGTERLRFSLSAAMTADDIDRLTQALRSLL